MGNKYDIIDLLRNLNTSIQPHRRDRAKNIVGFSVTTDSVVATATVNTDNNMKRIVVTWGDGSSDTHAAIPGGTQLPSPAGDPPLPPGTYQFHHAYDVSEDKKSFDHLVLLRVEDRDGDIDFRFQNITLTPRYKVTHYRVSVRLPAGCDPFWESENEFDITQLIDGETVNEWTWKPSNNFFSEALFYRLEGSAITRELTAEDPSVNVTLVFVEKDWFFDDGVTANMFLSINGESGLVEFTAGASGCKVIIRYDREIKLIVPLPSFGGGVFAPL
jgi:hypothetical protein